MRLTRPPHRCQALLAWSAALAPSVVLSLGLFLFAGALAAPEARAQSGDFRTGKAKALSWKPEHQVALTTDKYAREYVERYVELIRGYARGGEFDPETTLLALFQTEHHDLLFINEEGQTDAEHVFLIRREDHEVLYTDVKRWPPRTFLKYRFLDWSGDGALEFVVSGSRSGGTGVAGYEFTVYDLGGESLDAVYSRAGRYNDHDCPSLQTSQKIRSKIVRTSPPLVRLGYQHQFVQKNRGPCTFELEAVEVEEVCRAEEAGEPVECERDIDPVRLGNADDVKGSCYHWRYCAENVRWVLSNYEALREANYKISDRLLLRLPYHLPKDERQKYRDKLEEAGLEVP